MEITNNPTQAEIKKAAQALKDGHLVAFPTETVYGLGADATNEKAVSRIYSVKGRPTDHPLIVHVSSIDQLSKWAVEIPEYAMKLAQAFWPGPMTLILKRSNLAKNFITGGQANVGVRLPAHPVALALLREFEMLGGSGVAAPSANKFNAVSPTNANAVTMEIGDKLSKYDIILDGGQCLVGIESTIIGCSGQNATILRPGAVTLEMIKSVVGSQVSTMPEPKTKVPGMLGIHYSPVAEVQIGLPVKPGEGFLALEDIQSPAGSIRLASPKNLEQFANQLYRALRFGDEKKLTKIVVIPPEGPGLATAIRDRLLKSAGNKNV